MDLKNTLDGEWTVESKSDEELARARELEMAAREARKQQEVESLVSVRGARIRSALVTVTKIGTKTVIGEGISHDYV
jgi:hypothetical protein